MTKETRSNRWFPLATDRLLLREFTIDDAADIHEYGGDPVVSQYTDWGPNTLDQTREFLKTRLRDQQTWPRDEIALAAELRSERKVIGSVGLSILDGAAGIASYGYAFNRAYWNNGYATEAGRAILAVAFYLLEFHRIFATCDIRNVGSWRVMEKMGMLREATLRQNILQKGEWRDSYEYAILETDEAIGRL